MSKYPQPARAVMHKTTTVGDRKMDDWELDNAVSTLQKAEEIKADKELMAALAPRLDKAVAGVTHLKKLRATARRLKAEGK